MDPSPALREFEALVRERVEPIVRGAALGWNESGLHEGTWGRQAVGMGPDGEIEIHPPDESVISALFEGDAEEFNRAHPGLAVEEEEIDCVDLWIKYFPRKGQIEAQLEGKYVTDWLRHHGHESMADEIASRNDLASAIDALSRGLSLMLRRGI